MHEIICVICNDPIDIKKDKVSKWKMAPNCDELLVHTYCLKVAKEGVNRWRMKQMDELENKRRKKKMLATEDKMEDAKKAVKDSGKSIVTD